MQLFSFNFLFIFCKSLYLYRCTVCPFIDPPYYSLMPTVPQEMLHFTIGMDGYRKWGQQSIVKVIVMACDCLDSQPRGQSECAWMGFWVNVNPLRYGG